MKPELFLKQMDIALDLLPEKMRSVEARALILAICFQESELKYRKQMPIAFARSYAQFEKMGISGVINHKATADYVIEVCVALDIESHFLACYEAITYSDLLCICFARLLLWTLPDRLPKRDEYLLAFNQYLEAWRPGKPRPDKWEANFEKAWSYFMG